MTSHCSPRWSRARCRWLLAFAGAATCSCLAIGCPAKAQTVKPVIVEYTGKGDGRFEVTNDTLLPMAVILEPRSFSINQDGRGVFRTLDSGIHVKLSTTSFRLEPKQTYYVFYKATADTLPAWFTIYSGFSTIEPGDDGLKVRIMLPHTVYLYQKAPIDKAAVHLSQLSFVPASDTVICDLRNDSADLVRVQEVRAIAGHKSIVAAGFPLLPGATRHLSLDWKDPVRPEYLILRFPQFELKEPLGLSGP